MCTMKIIHTIQRKGHIKHTQNKSITSSTVVIILLNKARAVIIFSYLGIIIIKIKNFIIILTIIINTA